MIFTKILFNRPSEHDQTFIVMELIKGQELKDRIDVGPLNMAAGLRTGNSKTLDSIRENQATITFHCLMISTQTGGDYRWKV